MQKFNQIPRSSSINSMYSLDSSRSLASMTGSFSFNNLSEILKEPEYDCWQQIYICNNEKVLKRIFNYRLPLNKYIRNVNTLKCNFNCGSNHNMKTYTYSCCVAPENSIEKVCPVNYKVNHCTNIQSYKVLQYSQHLHQILERYEK